MCNINVRISHLVSIYNKTIIYQKFMSYTASPSINILCLNRLNRISSKSSSSQTFIYMYILSLFFSFFCPIAPEPLEIHFLKIYPRSNLTFVHWQTNILREKISGQRKGGVDEMRRDECSSETNNPRSTAGRRKPPPVIFFFFSRSWLLVYRRCRGIYDSEGKCDGVME